jgi:putative transposase
MLLVEVFHVGKGAATEAAYLALGITEEGNPEVLGFWLLSKVSSTSWDDPLLPRRTRC